MCIHFRLRRTSQQLRPTIRSAIYNLNEFARSNWTGDYIHPDCVSERLSFPSSLRSFRPHSSHFRKYGVGSIPTWTHTTIRECFFDTLFSLILTVKLTVFTYSPYKRLLSGHVLHMPSETSLIQVCFIFMLVHISASFSSLFAQLLCYNFPCIQELSWWRRVQDIYNLN